MQQGCGLPALIVVLTLHSLAFVDEFALTDCLSVDELATQVVSRTISRDRDPGIVIDHGDGG